MAGIIPHGSRLHKLHLECLEKEKTSTKVPERKLKSEFEELMAMTKQDLIATAEMEEVDFNPVDTKEVIANEILEKRKTTE